MGKRATSTVIAAIAFFATGAATATAGSAPNPALKCFTDAGATCELIGKTGAHLVAQDGVAAGVYVSGMRLSGKSLAAVDFSFDWTGTPSGGAPRFSLPIDENGDGKTDAYAFLDWASCGNASTGGTVSTGSSTCAVDYGGTRYPNWDAFAAANPTYTVAKATPFIISDWTSDVVVTNVSFGSA